MAASPPATLLNPYCSVDDVKDVLKINRTDTSKDDQLIKAVNWASRWIDDRQRKDWLFHDYRSNPLRISSESQYLSGSQLFLPYSPVLSITEVKEGDTVMAADIDYILDADVPVLIKRWGAWLPVYKGFTDLPSQPTDSTERLLPPPAAVYVSITGTFGYAQATPQDIPTNLPSQIGFCAAQVAAVFSGHHRKETAGLDGEKSEILTNEIPKSVLEILGRRAPILI